MLAKEKRIANLESENSKLKLKAQKYKDKKRLLNKKIIDQIRLEEENGVQ